MSTISNDIVFALAERSERAPKIALSGPSGAGKTLSALMLACGIIDAPTMPEASATGKWSDIMVADTENGASKLYVGCCFNYKNYRGEIACVEVGKFTHIDLKPPFGWQRWVKVIEEASKRGKCLILDNISAEWSGQGGILDYVGSLGGRANDWKQGSAAHRAVLDAILRAPIPVIALLREDQKHEIVRVPDGRGGERTQVNKLGLKPQQRDGFEYELDVALAIDHASHTATVGTGKDRTGLFASKMPEPITPDTGRILSAWSRGGDEPIGSRSWVARRCGMLQKVATEAELLNLWEETRLLGGGLLTLEAHAQLKAVGQAAKEKLTKGSTQGLTPKP